MTMQVAIIQSCELVINDVNVHVAYANARFTFINKPLNQSKGTGFVLSKVKTVGMTALVYEEGTARLGS